MNQVSANFGGALRAALSQVVNSPSPSISVADACTPESFVDRWSRTLSEHARQLRLNGTSFQAPAVFVYVDDTGAFASKHADWIRRPMLGATPLDSFAGTLAVGTASLGGYAYPNDLVGTSAFEAVLQANGLQSSPTVALVSKTKLLIWPNGIDCERDCFEKLLDDSVKAINLETIDNALRKFDEGHARQNTDWWKDSALRTTVVPPEPTVQKALRIYLSGNLSDVALVKEEETSGNGRRDITIYPIQSNAINQTAVLELKTLRDVRTPVKDPDGSPIKMSIKRNIAWACSGVQQAAAYRDSEKLDLAFLCMYDFCAGNVKDVENAVTPHAKKYNVFARRYWITASHEEYRAHFYPLDAPVDTNTV